MHPGQACWSRTDSPAYRPRMTNETEGVAAVDARMELKCDKHGHLITTLWQTSQGVEPQIIEDGQIRPWEHDGMVFDRPCPVCGGMYGRAVSSLRQKIDEVPRGTVGEWTLLYAELKPGT
jgi:hypothetical protein